VNKKEVFATGEKSYRAYVMIKISKEDVDRIISDINNRKNTSILSPKDLDKQAKEVLDKKS